MAGPATQPVDYLEGLMEGFVAYDGDWRMTYMNAAGERLLGRTRAEVLGKTWHEAFPHAVGNPVDAMYQRVKKTRSPERMEYFYAHYGKWMEIAASPVRDGGVGVYFRDITDRKRAEAELQETARRKDEFLAVLAHELRNPLAPIANAVELFRLQVPGDPALQAARDLLERQTRHMVRLVDDLLDASRITSGKLRLRRERVALADVVQQALETARPHVQGHEFTLSLPTQPVHLDADPVRLAQVLANLLHNACKFTPPEGRIRLEAALDGPALRVEVSDSGVGIDAGHLRGVFDMFSQAAPALERSRSGLGIGLALARTLVEMHGGRIEARSEGPGKGSQFIVTLPTAAEGGSAPRAAPATRAPGGRRQVLVVDDNRDAAASLAMLLRAEGHAVEVAYDGREALDAAQRFSPDAVLLDLGMPVMNGLDACRALRARPGGDALLILALTGWGQEDDQRRSRDAGFDAHLVKPVDVEALRDLLAARPAA